MDKSYLAGYFDGEGTIGVYRSKGCKDPRYKSGYKSGSWVRTVAVINTFRGVLEELHKTFGGTLRKSRNSSLTKKQCYQWTIGSKDDIRDFLDTILPYLREKREQALVMLDFVDDKISGEEAERKLKRLKK
jgi:hypothetical protein